MGNLSLIKRMALILLLFSCENKNTTHVNEKLKSINDELPAENTLCVFETHSNIYFLGFRESNFIKQYSDNKAILNIRAIKNFQYILTEDERVLRVEELRRF